MTNFPVNIIIKPQGAVAGGKKVEGSLKRVENRADRLRSSLTRAFAVIGGTIVIRGLIKIMAQFEESMATVQAVTQATDTQMALLTETAKELGRTTRFTASQAADGLVLLSRAGFSVSESTTAVAGTLRLAQAAGIGLAQAADIAASSVRGFRLQATQTGRVVDVMALASSRSNTTVSQLGQGMKFVAPIAAGLGVSIEKTAAAMGVLSDSGLQASMAGTGLRRVMAELESPSAGTQKIFARMKVTTDQVKISQVGLASALETLRIAGIDTGTALQIFGQRGGPAFEVLSSNIPKVKRLSAQLEEAEGTAEQMAKTMDDTLVGAAKRATSAFQGYILNLDETLGVSFGLTESLDFLADSINNVNEAMGSGLRVAESERALVEVGNQITRLQKQIANLEKLKGKQGFLSDSQIKLHAKLDASLKKLQGTTKKTRDDAVAAAKAEAEAEKKRALAADQRNREAEGEDVITKRINDLKDENDVLQTSIDKGQTAARVREFQLNLIRKQVELGPDQIRILTELTEKNEKLNDVLDKREDPQPVVNIADDEQRIRGQVDALLERIGAAESLTAQMDELNRRFPEGQRDVESYVKAMEDLQLKGLNASNALGDGFTRAFIKIRNEADDLAAVGEKVVNVFANQATEALVKFAETGKFEFKAFASSILSDLSKILARLLIVQAISAFLPGGGGGGGGGSALGQLGSHFIGPPAPRANGGTTQPDRSFVVGENGPELFRPGITGSVMPNAASVQQEAPQVNLQVVNVDDPEMVPQAIGSGIADEAIINSLMRNKDRARQVLS